MSTTTTTPTRLPPVILYHYPYSPYARRVIWYLHLRRIPYMQCIQPPILPRPDLAHLAISYRRIPFLAVGRDVYLDSRLILAKLEALVPAGATPSSDAATTAADANSSSSNGGSNDHGGAILGPLGAGGGGDADGAGDRAAVERLLATLATGTGLFAHAAALLPASLPLLRDPRFLRDRAEFVGKKIPNSEDEQDDETETEQAALRAESHREVEAVFALLERTLLADGRAWVLGGDESDGPSLADIEAVWPLHWLATLPEGEDPPALDPARVSRARFPRVFAWIDRFRDAVRKAKRGVEVATLGGEEAAAVIKRAALLEEEGLEVDETEPLVRALGLKRGDVVEVWPTDTGFTHRDRGRLVGIGADEVVWETEAGVRVHAPRGGFRVRPAGRRAGL